MSFPYTSCLYATVAVHAFCIHRYIVGILWILHNQANIIKHEQSRNIYDYSGGYMIYMIDHATAVINWFYVLYRSIYLDSSWWMTWIVYFLLWYTCSLHSKNIYPNQLVYTILPYRSSGFRTYQKIHIAATLGMHIFLFIDSNL